MSGLLSIVSGITASASAGPYDIDFLVLAGGGSGGYSPFNANTRGGGGGAGGLRSSVTPTGGGGTTESALTVDPGLVYTITVGGGGSNSNGTNSYFGSIMSTGGGKGGQAQAGDGSSGGSGGGDAGFNSSGIGGSGIAGQGYAGGGGNPQGYASGAGGGAGGLGTAQPNGLANDITGTAVTYARGGDGYYYPETDLQPANTGNGGDGRAYTAGYGQLGASGVVILRMPTSGYSGITTGSPTVTVSGGNTILTYTSSGSYTT